MPNAAALPLHVESPIADLLEGIVTEFPEICPFCDEDLELGVAEIYYETREFSLHACCEESHAELVDLVELALEDRKKAEAFFAPYGVAVRRVLLDGRWTLDYGLTLDETLERTTVRDFISEHHEHNEAPLGDLFRLGVYNGPTLIAVATVGRPVARMIATREPGTVEITRLCVSRSIDPGLAWNACSMLYGAACREAKRRGYDKAITYTLDSEAGTTLVAAGFELEYRSRGGSWNRPSRSREDRAPTGRKYRWARALRKSGRVASYTGADRPAALAAA